MLRRAPRMPVGWRTITFASVAMIMTVYGQTAGVSVFVDPLIEELDVSRSAISTVYSAASLIAAAMIPWVGGWIDRVGVRRATILIAGAFGLTVAGLAMTINVLWLAVGFFGIRLLGQGALSLASKTMVAIHFRAGLGRAVGITGAIAAVGMAIVPVVMAATIDAGGWRLAWLLGAASLWVVVTPVTLWALPRGADRLEREDEAEAAHAPTRWSRGMAMRTPMFWVITLGGASASLIITGLTFHQISILGQAGLSPTAAAANFLPQTVASVSAVAAVGVLSDRLPPRRLLISAMALLVLGVLLIPVLAVPLVPIAYAAALGAGLGSTQALEGALYVRYFGVHAIGAIRGAAFSVTVAAAALGPVLVGLAHELTGGYTAALVMLVLPLLVGAAAAVIRPPHGSGA